MNLKVYKKYKFIKAYSIKAKGTGFSGKKQHIKELNICYTHIWDVKYRLGYFSCK